MFDWRSQAFPGYRPVHEPFNVKIVDVHWGKSSLYLYLSILLSNNRTGRRGPYPITAVDMPDMTLRTFDGVTKLDEYHNSSPNWNGTENGFFRCLQYEPPQNAWIDWSPFYTDENGFIWADPIFGPVGMSAEASYEYVQHNTHPAIVIRNSTDNFHSCPVTPTSYAVANLYSTNPAGAVREVTYYHALAHTPIDYYSRAVRQVEYFFAIKPGDEIMTLNVAGILSESNEAPFQTGFGLVNAAVFSTARTKLTKILQVAAASGGIDYADQKLDPDHEYTLFMSSDIQGTYFINVNKHEDPDYRQTDNYGKKFSPYRISFSPVPLPDDRAETVPEQPPIQLPLPSGVKA